MLGQPTIRLTIIRAIERRVREGRPEIAVLIVALCSSAVTLCTALIASILLAAVIEMRTPYKASYRACGDATQQESGARTCVDQAAEEPALQSQAGAPGGLDGRDQERCARGVRSLRGDLGRTTAKEAAR
jgi:hypothetical protein